MKKSIFTLILVAILASIILPGCLVYRHDYDYRYHRYHNHNYHHRHGYGYYDRW